MDFDKCALQLVTKARAKQSQIRPLIASRLRGCQCVGQTMTSTLRLRNPKKDKAEFQPDQFINADGSKERLELEVKELKEQIEPASAAKQLCLAHH